MMTTFTIVNVDYVMYEHFMLWMQWLRIFTYDAIGYSIYIYDVPHHLMMFDCWIYKLYYAMHRWNMTIQKKYHPIFNSLLINIMSWIGKFYGFLRSGYNQIIINSEDQEKTTFTCPFGTYVYRRMPFGLCNELTTFQRYMMSIFSYYVERIIEVFMDDFMVYGDYFDKCLENLSLVLKRCIETNFVLNYEQCYFMVEKEIVLGHVVSSRGLEVDKAKIDVISSLPYPSCMREVHYLLGNQKLRKWVVMSRCIVRNLRFKCII